MCHYKMDVRIKHPFTGIIAGPTGCGKTSLLLKILRNLPSVVNVNFSNIIWCYGEYQPSVFQQFPDDVKLVHGLPDFEELDASVPNLVIIDDLMQEAGKSTDVANLFTRGSHHRNASVFLLTQNLFHGDKKMRTISLNAHYIIAFKNPRDSSQIVHLAKQMFPGNTQYLREAFKMATSRPYGYIFLDMKQDTPDELRVRTGITPDEKNIVYLPK